MRDAECRLDLDRLDGPLVLYESAKVGVCHRVEKDL
jgi:hypothetical protein